MFVFLNCLQVIFYGNDRAYTFELGKFLWTKNGESKAFQQCMESPEEFANMFNSVYQTAGPTDDSPTVLQQSSSSGSSRYGYGIKNNVYIIIMFVCLFVL